MLEDAFVNSLSKHVEFRPVCPEAEIGLGIPRKPVRLVKCSKGVCMYQPATGADVTERMTSFVNGFLDRLPATDGFILKFRSPSCGMKNVRVYHSKDKGSSSVRGEGMFGGAVAERYRGCAVEDEGRLKNRAIREHFLTQLFALAKLRNLQPDIKALTDFHAENKYLMLAYSQKQLRMLGKIAANHDKRPIKEVMEDYQQEFSKVFLKMPKESSMCNVLMHALGYFKQLTSEEKQFFLESIEEYRDERIPLSTVLHLLRAWSIREKNEYFLGQSLMNPFPEELVSKADSGR
jgi:uncharacterized protein YbgA (DUF1722 family)/uncharacterized protein YbbK (DUF523 family)